MQPNINGMKFKFDVQVPVLENKILHTHKLFLIGSCFTENIGDKLKKHKFTVLENPNGIIFNPVSVAETIINCIENKVYTTDDLFELNEAWHSWQHHSKFSGITPQEAVAKINTSTQHAHEYLKTTDFLIITLGSAWIYTLTQQAANAQVGTVAANNHKAPANWFERKLMDASQVITVLATMLDRLGKFNPNIQVIFTISPVRHLREGAIDNNRSKAALISAIHYLTEKLPKLYYFPAYELVIDDLRDYRFYAEDLVHPNYFATQYVWEKLVEACLATDAITLLQQIADINLAYQHHPFNTQSAQHKKFLAAYLEKTKQLQNQHSYLDFSREISYFSTGEK